VWLEELFPEFSEHPASDMVTATTAASFGRSLNNMASTGETAPIVRLESHFENHK
jgi:hypothetical protein